MQRLPDSPLSASQIVGRGLELGAACYGKLFMASSLTAFIWLLPTLDTALRLGNVVLTPDYLLHDLLGWHWLMVWVLTLCLLLLVHAFMVTRLDRFTRGGIVDFQAEWGASRRAFLPFAGALLLYLLIIVVVAVMAAVLGSLAGGIVALFAGQTGFVWVLRGSLATALTIILVYLPFIPFLVVLEHKSPIAALNGSFTLVYDYWWHAFTVLLVLIMLMLGIAVLAALPVAPLFHYTDGLGDGRTMLAEGVLQMVITALSGPFTLSVMYLVYNDLKLRHRTAA